MANSFDRLKDLNLTRDEVNRIGEALKNQEFRKLLADYVEEIQDPKNRQIYEEEVKQIERERGQEVTFLHPVAGYVIKTSVNGNQKCFINICSNENIAKPSSSPSIKDGTKGLNWTLPHSLSPPHEDFDNKGIQCKVYDVLFHPDTLHLSSKNCEFQVMLNKVALDAVEKAFDVNLDKKNMKFPKMSYKGLKRASIIRKCCEEQPVGHPLKDQEIYNKIYSEIDSQRKLNSKKIASCKKVEIDNSSYTSPKYILKHRSHVDIQEFTEHKNAKLNVAIPKELIVEINLPLLRCSSDMDLDVTEKTIHLISEKPAKYKLYITLPYQVNEASGSAKFDKDLKKLVITLPVRRNNVYDMTKDDSGVESCLESDFFSMTGVDSDEDCLEPVNSSNQIKQHINGSKPDSSCTKSEYKDDFLNGNPIYNLPEFTCNAFDNVVAFTLNVKSVDERTVVKQYISEHSLVILKFVSVSPTFFPCNYAFYIKFPQHQIIEEDVIVETWDNNLILQISLEASDIPLVSYLCGVNFETLSENFIDEHILITRTLKQSANQIVGHEVKTENRSKVDWENMAQKKYSNEKNSGQSIFFEKVGAAQSKNMLDRCAISYESSGDELSISSFSPRKSKGILKMMSGSWSKLARSVSESSLDDFFGSSFDNYHGSIDSVPENTREDDGISSSMKKTVRFNDVVTKQLFRSNSSILGQKKKNQRKARNKKRAHERRYSESEASDVESKKERDDQTDSQKIKAVAYQEANKNDDSDIFLLEINN